MIKRDFYVDGGYLSWVYGVSGSGLNSWNTTRTKYSRKANVAFLMDSPTPFRYRQVYYPPYKAHRAEKVATKPEWAEKKERVDQFRDLLFEDPTIETFWVEGHEADDLVGILAIQEKKPLPVVGRDKDLLQLGKLLALREHSGEPVTMQNFIARQPKKLEGLVKTPGHLLLSLALMGDKSDDIPRLIPPYELELMAYFLKSRDPWFEAVRYLGAADVFRNLYLTVLPGPWTWARYPAEKTVFKMVREGTYLRETMGRLSKEVKSGLSIFLR